jgi:hypothetical protein
MPLLKDVLREKRKRKTKHYPQPRITLLPTRPHSSHSCARVSPAAASPPLADAAPPVSLPPSALLFRPAVPLRPQQDWRQPLRLQQGTPRRRDLHSAQRVLTTLSWWGLQSVPILASWLLYKDSEIQHTCTSCAKRSLYVNFYFLKHSVNGCGSEIQWWSVVSVLIVQLDYFHEHSKYLHNCVEWSNIRADSGVGNIEL